MWSFLLFSGYLKASGVRVGDRTVAKLRIPNREVVLGYRAMFLRWLDEGLGEESEVGALCHSLLSGDEIGFEPVDATAFARLRERAETGKDIVGRESLA